MPTFRYRTLSTNGQSATIEAPDRASAVRELLRKGMTPSAIEEIAAPGLGPRSATVDTAAPAASRGLVIRRVMSRAETAWFIRELATALQAGLPLVQALRTIGKQGRSPAQQAMLARLIDDVEHGRSLAEAAADVGKPFTELMINMIRAGEASGRLADVLAQSAELLDADVKLRRSLLSATLYPMILGVLIIAAMVVLVTFIVPGILKTVEGNLKTLPLPTLIVKGLADFMQQWWWLVVLGLVAAVFVVYRLLADPAIRLIVDARLLRVPLLGRLLRDVAVARFTRTLATLSSAGVPILTALRVTRGTLGNKALERVIDQVCEQVSGGKTIADPMERSGYFPPMLVQIVSIGERSGRLDQMLSQAAGAFEEKTQSSVKMFTTALPPLLVVIMACAVGFMVMAILLPVIEMQGAIR